MPIIAQFEFDPIDYRTGLRDVWSFNRARWVVPVVGIAIPALMIWLAVGRHWRESSLADAFWNALPWMLLGAFYLSLLPLMRRTAARKALQEDPALRGTQMRTVDDAGLHIRGAGLSQDLRWADLVRVEETTDFFLFFYNRSAAHYIPKRVLGDRQRDELRNLIQAHVPEVGASALAARSA
jgi:hypothetical protein